MDNRCTVPAYGLLCVIVDCGTGSRVMHTARECGVTGGTIVMGAGTVNNRFLEFLSGCDIRKELVLMVAPGETACLAAETISKKFKFHKQDHGIAFLREICGIEGASSMHCAMRDNEGSAENSMYKAITVIVDKGNAERVIEAAQKAGSKGGTIINARGAGVHETGRLFAMDIEPEKEMVLILAKIETVEPIAETINRELNMKEPGNGILFVQNIVKTYGIYE